VPRLLVRALPGPYWGALINWPLPPFRAGRRSSAIENGGLWLCRVGDGGRRAAVGRVCVCVCVEMGKRFFVCSAPRDRALNCETLV
jgi:hypothetical protein